jgi:MoaA/NifB/PqqE/SkfB family radical SAM enzyme
MTEPPIHTRIERRRERLHIALGTECNNNCIFCVEADRAGRRAANAAMTVERVGAILAAHRDAEEVCFTSGEPTTRPDLASLVRLARELGFGTVSLMTNGRRLAYPGYAAALAAAGITRLCISIHGHEPRLHDGMTRTPGSFVQTVAGLEQAARLRAAGVELHTSTVVTRRNLPKLPELVHFLRSRGVDQIVLNVMQPTGRAEQHFARLFPRYRAIVDAFSALLAALGEPRARVFLVDVPLCASERLPDFNRGFVERQLHYELRRDARTEPAQAAPLTALERVSRDDLDRVERRKRAECSACRYEPVCEGVWRIYLEHYGWDELMPVAPSGRPLDTP